MSQNAYVDGDILAKFTQAGVMSSGGIEVPAIKFFVRPDKGQGLMDDLIPFWAVGRLAAVVYSYADTARQIAGVDDVHLQVNVKADIRTNGDLVLLQAYSVRFHTSRNIRQVAELRIVQMTGSGRWPERGLIVPPDGADVLTVSDDRRYGGDQSRQGRSFSPD